MADSNRAADLAQQAVDAATDRNYADASTGEEGDRRAGLQTDISDLLANLRHLCDRHGFDFADIDDHAYLHYNAERGEGVADGEPIPRGGEPAVKLVPLSLEAYAVLCGVVAPSNEVNAQGIHSDAWDELRRAFPVNHFHIWANAHPNDGESDSFYDPEAGE
jgi:hypothetical protein